MSRPYSYKDGQEWGAAKTAMWIAVALILFFVGFGVAANARTSRADATPDQPVTLEQIYQMLVALTQRVAAIEQGPAAPATAPVAAAVVQSYQLGCTGKNVGEVQAMIGLSVVCLGTEYDAYTWRSVPIEADAICPQGWICTLHLADNNIVVVQGNDSKYSIQAGTFRRLSGYPTSDAVHNACALLVKEQVFGASQTPSFPVEAMGFSCQNGQVVGANATQALPSDDPAEPITANTCPTSPAEAAQLLGGSAGSWKLLANTNGEGWKYEGASIKFNSLTFGRIDGDGWTMNVSDPRKTGTVATFWCNG